ncbi:MAG: hypothetical protein HY042_10390 [Spirochaetia bacterium]|nr:hypothetical protein [Spirochaetia bacterium]
MHLPGSNATGVLLDEVREKLTAICRNGSVFSSRILKAGAYRSHPVTVLAPPPGPVGSSVLPTADQLAHSLTRNEHPALVGRLRKVIIVPECHLARNFLLTHVFFPAEGMLGVYLYPRRFDESATIQAGGRLDTSVLSPGLLGSSLEQISTALTFHDSQAPLQFLVSAGALRADEAVQMQDTDDYYSLRSGS